MAKITQLPKATAANDADIIPIVQDGETKQIPRSLLVPAPLDDLQIDGNHLQLTANGETVGDGVDLPKITIDSELSDASENPVQNRAVAAALGDTNAFVNTACANALKKTVTVNGETTLDNVSPLSELKISGAQAGQTVTIRGKNLLAIPERERENIEITDEGIVVSKVGRQILLNPQELAALDLKAGATVTTSVTLTGEIAGTAGQVVVVSNVSGISNITLRATSGKRTYVLPDDYDPANYLGLCLYGACTYQNLQIEYGTEATEYEQGFAVVTVTADENGKATVQNIPHPTAVIETDGTCTVEYNRDANKVLENIENAILSLGGDI